MLNDSIAMEPYDALASRFERLVEIALNSFFRSVELHQFGKKSESLRDRLLCMQKIGLVTSVELWMEMRDFRNRIAHDYLPEQLSTASGQFLTTIRHNNLDVQLVIDKPESTSADVVMTFHGTVETDDKIVAAATKTLEETKKLASKKNILYISVAYPEENLLMGDNLAQAEAALLWVKQKAPKELNIKTNRVFLVDHSQGGYLVTRLNTMHSTDGVIANAPGPLDFKLRCELEENGEIDESSNCARMRAAFGNTKENPDAYTERSLLTHLRGFKSRILFTQGMSDAKIQLRSWPILREKAAACSGCASAQSEELDGSKAPQTKTTQKEMHPSWWNNFLLEHI
jgi:hypothetical protein